MNLNLNDAANNFISHQKIIDDPKLIRQDSSVSTMPATTISSLTEAQPRRCSDADDFDKLKSDSYQTLSRINFPQDLSNNVSQIPNFPRLQKLTRLVSRDDMETTTGQGMSRIMKNFSFDMNDNDVQINIHRQSPSSSMSSIDENFNGANTELEPFERNDYAAVATPSPIHDDCSLVSAALPVPSVPKSIDLLLPHITLPSYLVNCSADVEEVSSFHNPLYNPNLLLEHLSSTNRELTLDPLKPLLSRLMGHTLNRHGLFNSPVDARALGLFDYNQIIKKPMDLGTVKDRLFSISYSGIGEFAEDVRLTFHNAMTYNPPGHPVHKAAKELLETFEENFHSFAAATSDRSDSQLKFQSSDHISGMAVDFSVPDKAYIEMSEQRVMCGDSNAITSHTGTESPHSSEINMKVNLPPLPNLPPCNYRKSNPSSIQGKKNQRKHSCMTCRGQTCAMCYEPCIPLESTLLTCHDTGCGQKIRKGAFYHVTKDGSRTYCHKCFSNLCAVLPSVPDDVVEQISQESEVTRKRKVIVRYKRDLLKRKNEEETVEPWITCSKCLKGMHHICAMYNPNTMRDKSYICPLCYCSNSPFPSVDQASDVENSSFEYTFVSGRVSPVAVPCSSSMKTAKELPLCGIGQFIQDKVRARMLAEGCDKGAEKTVLVRVISNIDRKFRIPDVVRRHFRIIDEFESDVTNGNENSGSHPVPPVVQYNSKAIALFQRIDGMDVCIFCMYVQEYDDPLSTSPRNSNKCPEQHAFKNGRCASRGKRVYIAYLDSIDYFRPRKCRTPVYQEVLLSYLATARARGYQAAHIWACPPIRGNSFVFWSRPPQQRTPTHDRLIAWYHAGLSRAVDKGIVTDIRSLYETVFEKNKTRLDGTEKAICPPLLEGDFWIEDVVRVQIASIAKHLRNTCGTKNCRISSVDPWKCSRCPVVQVASMIQSRIIPHPSAFPFRRPVNAAALKLNDYHDVITHPMDLGTVHGKCLVGEYDTLKELVEDVELVFSNAMRYNPKGNPVHMMAIEIRNLFFQELKILAEHWKRCFEATGSFDLIGFVDGQKIEEFYDMSMRISTVLEEGVEKQENDIKVSTEATRTNLAEATTGNSVQSGIAVSEPPQCKPEGISEEVSLEETTVKTSVPQMVTASPNKRSRDDNCSTSSKQENKRQKKSNRKFDLFKGGPEAIDQQMIGDDSWLVEKKKPQKNKKKKAASSTATSDHSSSTGTKKESWLGGEVGETIRHMRRDFFVCNLSPKPSHERSEAENEKISEFESYLEGIDFSAEGTKGVSNIADARHVLLETSQFRNFQFDTLRRAKHSTSMLVYHLHHPDAPGLIPICSVCNKQINQVRWHKTREEDVGKEELCTSCHSGVDNKDDFIPVRVSLRNVSV